MLQLITLGRFERELKKMKKRKKDMNKLKNVITLIQNEIPLPIKYRNHKLQGEFKDYLGMPYRA